MSEINHAYFLKKLQKMSQNDGIILQMPQTEHVYHFVSSRTFVVCSIGIIGIKTDDYDANYYTFMFERDSMAIIMIQIEYKYNHHTTVINNPEQIEEILNQFEFVEDDIKEPDSFA